MSYQTRNIIVLFIFCALISLVSGSFTVYHYPRKIGKVNKNIEKLKKQISALEGIENKFCQLEKAIKEQEGKIANWDKKIVSSVSSATTYKYLDTILKYCGVIEFNLFFGESKSSKGYNYNVFRVKGEGSFGKIFRFISYLERGPEIYKINKLKLKLVESKDPETGKDKIVIPFEMELWSLYADVNDLPQINRTLNDVHVKNISNPFYPYIRGNIPPNINNLLEVERAELKAVLPEKVMIADNSGKIHVLREGDEVYLGYLSKIDLEKNQVEFVLNKGGLVDKFTLQLRFDKQIK